MSCYIIKSIAKDTNKYIQTSAQSKFTVTTSPERATKFPDAIAAMRWISTQMSKKQRDNWTVVSYEPTRYEIDINVVSDIPQVFNWDDVAKRLKDFFMSLYKYKDEMSSQIATMESELCDCEHACEFYDLETEDGYRLYKMIHDRRIKRRYLKDEYRKAASILSMSLADFASGKVSEMLKEVDNQVYEPRALRELFYNKS